MPEGDTIHLAARRLQTVLQGQTIVTACGRDEIGDVNSIKGLKAETVKVHGKHLMFHFENQSVLHSHMGMTGAWHIYAHQRKWQKPKQQAAIVLQTEYKTIVCFSPRHIQLTSKRQLRRDHYLQRLGPDLLAETISDQQFLQRIRTQNRVPIGVAIMNQTVIAGIGNVYKSEVLFLEHLHPKRLVRQISNPQLCAVRDTAQHLMKRNLSEQPRRTRFRSDQNRLWVYGRKNDPCLKCGEPIQLIRQGDLARSTYFCPDCQPSP